MAFGETLYTKITGTAAITALVGNRVYPVQIRQRDTLPLLRYTRITTSIESAMGSDVGITKYRYQFDAYGETYETADDVITQVKLALVRWRQSGVQDSFFVDQSDDYQNDIKLYRVRCDIEFIAEE